MKNYLDLLKKVVNKGELRKTRQKKEKVISLFGERLVFSLYKKKIPIITTRQISWKVIIKELLWFINGKTNVSHLIKEGVNIWNKDAYRWYCEKNKKSPLNFENYILKLKNDQEFAKKYGDLGPIYGKQWTDFFGVNQLKNVLESLKHNPLSRRHLVSSWNPKQLPEMALPPCHVLFQFYLNNKNELSCQLYQRSADLFLGVPFNIASYSFLTRMIAKLLNFKVGKLIHIFGDCHIYLSHLDKVKKQLLRKPFPQPELEIKDNNQKTLSDFKLDDFIIKNYLFHDKIKGNIIV